MNGGISLSVVALVTVISISFVSWLTEDAVTVGKQRWIEQSLKEIVPSELHDEQMVKKFFNFQHQALGSTTPLPIYPIIKDNVWNGAAITAIAPDGYTGEIKMLIAVRTDHSLLGVRILEHQETPGLGDDIERDKSEWITQFDDASLENITAPLWTVKKYGGAFDQFTGATITPSAVVHTIHRVLTWHRSDGLNELQQHFKDTQ